LWADPAWRTVELADGKTTAGERARPQVHI
jgi:hypothetical protein